MPIIMMVPYDDLDFTLTEIKKLSLKVVVPEVDIDIVKQGKWWLMVTSKHREELKSLTCTKPCQGDCPPEKFEKKPILSATFAIVCVLKLSAA